MRWKSETALRRPDRPVRPAATAGANEPLSLGQLLAPLRRRWGTVALMALCGMALALFIGFEQDPVYQATALLELQGINDDFLHLRELAPATSENLLEPYLQTQIKVLQSSELQARVAEKLKLRDRDEFRASPSWGAGLFRTAVPPGRDQLLRELSRHLTVRVSGQSRVIEVLAESRDPRLASDLANAVSTEYVEYTVARRAINSRNTSEWLGDQLRDLKTNLEGSEEAMQRYARQEGLLYTSETNNVAESKLQQLQEALSKAQAARMEEQARYERASASPADALPEVLDDGTLRDYQVKLTDLRRQSAELMSTLTPEHYRVQEVGAQIAELETALNRRRASVLGRTRNQYDSAVRREKLEAAAYAAQAGLVGQQAAKSVRYKSLKQEADSNRRLYESMLQKVKETGIASAVRATNVQVLNAATVPGIPARPNLPLYSAAGLLVGLAAGMTWVFARGNGGVRIRMPGEAASFLGYPELGAVPYAREAAGGEEESCRAKPDSPVAEAIRGALASVLLAAPAGQRSRVLVVTSASPGEGKTTIASNLAAALAETNQRVLLVDGHLRQPRLHGLFNVPNTGGLSSLLGDTASRLRHRAAERCVATDVEGLFLLPAGDGGTSMANRLYSPRLPQLLECLREQFDAVVVDAAPLSLLDARPLARAADGVVLVIGARQTSQNAAQEALRRLQEDGTPVLGTVLNDCGPKKAPARHSGMLAFPSPVSSLRPS
jgi:capsular exopolysaccharide synthesis family protein